MNPITTKFERNKHLLTKSTLYQIGWLDEETGVDILTEWRRRGGNCIELLFGRDILTERCRRRGNCIDLLPDLDGFYHYGNLNDYFEGSWHHGRATKPVLICNESDYTASFLPSCFNTTFLAMEGPIKDYGFTTEWKSLAIADGTILMFDYGSINLIDGYGPDYRIDPEINFDYDNKKKY